MPLNHSPQLKGEAIWKEKVPIIRYTFRHQERGIQFDDGNDIVRNEILNLR